jgi:hypothetical protein
MVAIVVVTIGVASVAVLDQSASESRVTADVDVRVGSGSLTVEHGGGDPLPFGEVFVVVRGDSDRWRYTITQSNAVGDDGDADFEPGERWHRAGLPWGPGDVLDVAVYETVSDARLFRNRFTVTDPSDDDGGDTAIPRLESASRVDDTTIDVTLRDAESGLLKSSISADDFEVSSGTIDSVDLSAVTTGSTAPQTVTLRLGSEPTTGTVTVSVVGDAGGISDVAGNVLVSGSAQATGFDDDADAPSVTVAAAFDDASDDLTVTVSADEALDASAIAVDVASESDDVATLTGFTERGSNTYEATYTVTGAVEETYTATVTRAEDPAGNDGASGQTDSVFVDTRPPAVGISATFEGASDTVAVTVTADESLNEDAIAVDLATGGGTVATLTDFTERGADAYEATYAIDGATEETYTATVTRAEDPAGNDGASGQTDSVTVDTRPPAVDVSATFDDATDELTVKVTGDEALNEDAIAVDIVNESGDATTLTDFAERGSNAYEATYAVDAAVEETYTATVTRAEDLAGNDGAASQTDSVTVDTRAPRIDLTVIDSSIPIGADVIVVYRLSYTVTDADPESATLTLYRTGTKLGETSVSETGDSGTFGPILGSRDRYTFQLTVTDAAGNEACKNVVDVANGRPNGPIRDQTC